MYFGLDLAAIRICQVVWHESYYLLFNCLALILVGLALWYGLFGLVWNALSWILVLTKQQEPTFDSPCESWQCMMSPKRSNQWVPCQWEQETEQNPQRSTSMPHLESRRGQEAAQRQQPSDCTGSRRNTHILLNLIHWNDSQNILYFVTQISE